MSCGHGSLTKIPEGANPYRAIVNGVEHDYEAGSQAPVAPGVKELINAADNFPPAAEEVQPPFSGGGGGGGGVLVVHEEYDEEQSKTSLDKTWREIRDAVDSMPILVVDVISMLGTETLNLGYIMSVGSNAGSSQYSVVVLHPGVSSAAAVTWRMTRFSATSEDGYPSYTE